MHDISSTETLKDAGSLQEKASSGMSSSKKTTYISGIFLLIICSLTGFLFWQQRTIEAKIQSTQSQLSEYQSKITLLKSDPQVRASEILATQKDVIEKTIEKSNAARYIRELTTLSSLYGVAFNGFTFSQNKVSTTAVAQKGLDDDAIRKIIRLIGGYRETKKDMISSGTGGLSPFKLAPVLSVSGDSEKRNIHVDFTIQ
jgi:hypothetical protein